MNANLSAIPAMRGKHLADLNAGDVGLDRIELAADLLRRLGLDLPHVLVGWAAAEEDIDERLVAGARQVLLRASARRMSASVRLTAPNENVPTFKKFRRLTPSQNRTRPKGILSIARCPVGMG